MITNKNKVTRVIFGTNQKASICVSGSKKTLFLEALIKNKKVGDIVKKGDYKHLPKVELVFASTESVDIMIKSLELIKKNITPHTYHFCYVDAC